MAGPSNDEQKAGKDRTQQKPLKDLDIKSGDVDKVKGGARRADPCDGGEIAPR